MTRTELLGLRITLGASALGALAAQLIVVPRTAAALAEAYPEVAHLVSPYLNAVILAIGGFEVALVAAWMLLSRAAGDGASAGRTRGWVNAMVLSLGFTAVVLAGVFVHAGWVGNVGGPPMMFGLLASLAVLLAAPLLRRRSVALLSRDPA